MHRSLPVQVPAPARGALRARLNGQAHRPDAAAHAYPHGTDTAIDDDTCDAPPRGSGHPRRMRDPTVRRRHLTDCDTNSATGASDVSAGLRTCGTNRSGPVHLRFRFPGHTAQCHGERRVSAYRCGAVPALSGIWPGAPDSLLRPRLRGTSATDGPQHMRIVFVRQHKIWDIECAQGLGCTSPARPASGWICAAVASSPGGGWPDSPGSAFRSAARRCARIRPADVRRRTAR